MIAENKNLVLCNGMDCNLCSLLETLSGFFNWLLVISSVVAVAFLVWGGMMYLFSFGKKKSVEKSKETLKKVLSGFTFVIISWIVVSSLFRLLGASKNNWWEVDCLSGRSDLIEKEGNSNQKGSQIDPEKIISSINVGGEIGGKIREENVVPDLEYIISNISEDNLVVILDGTGETFDPWVVFGKTDGVLEIIYADTAKIKKMAFAQSKFFPVLVKEAKASNEEIGEVAETIKQLIFGLIEERKNQFLYILKKPSDFVITPSTIPYSLPTKLIGPVKKLVNCIESGGKWHRIAGKCLVDEKGGANGDCLSEDLDYPIDKCVCPSNKVLDSTGFCGGRDRI